MKRRVRESFETKLHYLTDVLDQYSNMVSDGKRLSPQQKEQVEEILDWMTEHNSNDNPAMDDYIGLAQELLGESRKRNNVRLTESDIRAIVKESVRRLVKESIDYDDYGAISNALAKCGWAYTDTINVHNRYTGQEGIRYIIEPYPNNPDGVKPVSVDVLKQYMIQLIGEENIHFTEGQHRYAPEIRNLSMVVVEKEY